MSVRRQPGPSSVVLFVAALPLAIAAVLCTGPAEAARVPSKDLRVVASVSPDTVTVGDPIRLLLEGSAPDSGRLLLPELADSLGPFTVVSVTEEPPAPEPGRRTFRRAARLAAFRTGELRFPALPLLWVVGPDTAVAYTQPRTIQVVSVLPDTFRTADPGAALAQLRDVKPVVPLLPSRIWLWVLLGAAALALAVWAGRRWLRSRRRVPRAPEVETVPAAPALPPEVRFRRGLEELEQAALLPRGEVKEYTARLSLLLRGYLEGRYGIPAVEETREEILRASASDPRLDEDERAWLARWLADADLVKFAKVDRLLEEARRATTEAADWVERTTGKARKREAEEARRRRAEDADRGTGSAGPEPETELAGTGEARP